MFDNYYAMILAGGGGTRLWPLSRKTRPKQVLSLVSEQSMFEVSVQRLAPLFTPDRILVVTGAGMVNELRQQVPELPAENFIIEPFGQDSGPAAALGVMHIQRRNPNAVVALLTADHHIAKPDLFREVLKAAYDAASQDYIVTLGISPTFPATGFGYIERGDKIGDMHSFEVYQSMRFREKPNVETAIEFLASGNFSWNAGMFIWKAERALQEFKQQRPNTYQQIMTIQSAIGTPHYHDTLNERWQKVEKLPVDIAVMENARQMAVIPVDIGWSDIGSWSSLYDALCEDDSQRANVHRTTEGRIVTIDSEGTLVLTERTVVTLGTTNLVVIDTGDVVFVCDRDQAQNVRAVIKVLQENGYTDLL